MKDVTHHRDPERSVRDGEGSRVAEKQIGRPVIRAKLGDQLVEHARGDVDATDADTTLGERSRHPASTNADLQYSVSAASSEFGFECVGETGHRLLRQRAGGVVKIGGAVEGEGRLRHLASDVLGSSICSGG